MASQAAGLNSLFLAKKTEPQLEGEVWEVFEFQEMWDVP